MLDLIKRNAYRIARNFSLLVVIQFTWEIISVPIFYVEGLLRWGWYPPSLWYYRFMIDQSQSFAIQFALLALMIILFWEIFRGMYLLMKLSFNASVRQYRKFSTN